jgi:hypothetical protein
MEKAVHQLSHSFLPWKVPTITKHTVIQSTLMVLGTSTNYKCVSLIWAVACSRAPTSKQSEISHRYTDATKISQILSRPSEGGHPPLVKLLTRSLKFWSHSKQFKSWCSWTRLFEEAGSRPNYGKVDHIWSRSIFTLTVIFFQRA